MSKLDITKQVPLSSQLYSQVQIRINQLGIKFPEYIRHLILIDTENIYEKVGYLSKEENDDVMEALRDVENGRTKQLKSKDEIKRYVEEMSE